VLLDTPQSLGGEIVKNLADEENCLFTPADVTSEDQVKAAMDSVKEKFGRLDNIVNCAGIAFAHKLFSSTRRLMFPLDKIQQILEVNVVGSLNVARYGMALIIDNQKDDMGQRGVIINTSSIAAYDGQCGQVAYSASKGAIASMTLPMARDFADMGVRVMAIAPGIFDTPIINTLPSKVKIFLNQLVPNPSRLGNPEEFAALVEHIINNRYLNGEVIRLDGALRMPP